MKQDKRVEETNRDESEQMESCGSGSCLTGQGICPGVTLLLGFVAGHIVYQATGSEFAGWVTGILVAAGLLMGLPLRMWRAFRRNYGRRSNGS